MLFFSQNVFHYLSWFCEANFKQQNPKSQFGLFFCIHFHVKSLDDEQEEIEISILSAFQLKICF